MELIYVIRETICQPGYLISGCLVAFYYFFWRPKYLFFIPWLILLSSINLHRCNIIEG